MRFWCPEAGGPEVRGPMTKQWAVLEGSQGEDGSRGLHPQQARKRKKLGTCAIVQLQEDEELSLSSSEVRREKRI